MQAQAQAQAEADTEYLRNHEVREVKLEEGEKIWNASRYHRVGKLTRNNVIGAVCLFPHGMFYGGNAIYPAYVGQVVSKYTTKAQDDNDGVPGYNVRFHDTKQSVADLLGHTGLETRQSPSWATELYQSSRGV